MITYYPTTSEKYQKRCLFLRCLFVSCSSPFSIISQVPTGRAKPESAPHTNAEPRCRRRSTAAGTGHGNAIQVKLACICRRSVLEEGIVLSGTAFLWASFFFPSLLLSVLTCNDFVENFFGAYARYLLLLYLSRYGSE